jgi:hypothetical protein
MNPIVLQALLVAGPFVFGIGMSALMFWFFDVVLRRLPTKDLLTNLATVFGWFVGNGALIFGTFTAFDLQELLQIDGATGVAFLTYLIGFGMTVAYIVLRQPPSLLRDLHKYLTEEEVEVVLLILRYEADPADAAKKLHLPENELQAIYEEALKKLDRRGQRILQAIQQRKTQPS